MPRTVVYRNPRKIRTVEDGYARRDRWIAAACNALLRFASPRYRAMIGGSISYGLKAAARDSDAKNQKEA